VVGMYSILIFLFANWLIYRRSRVLICAIFAIIFSAFWMLISAIYIDSSRVVYAEELYRKISGGISSIRLALMFLTFSMALLFAFTPSRLSSLKKVLNQKPLRIIKINGGRLNYIVTATMGSRETTFLYKRGIPVYWCLSSDLAGVFWSACFLSC